MPGWNAHVKEQHDRDAYWLWREMGKPRNGDIFTLMKLSRSRFKYAFRKCKREQEVIVSDSIANKMCQKESRNFCKEIRCTMNNMVKLPTSVDGVCGDANIASMWKSHYDNILNSVHDSHCDKVYNDICNTNIAFHDEMIVSVEEMRMILNDLACNKSPGLDSISAKHMKFAGPILFVLMALVVSSIITHSVMPRAMTESVIIPGIKNKNKRVNDNRPICLSNILCSKIVEIYLARRLNGHQFGFKSEHGTELCVFAFKELLRYYVEHGSAMHIAFLDASKVFDRVNRRKFLSKLESRGVAKYILRLLSYEFLNQHICIRWGSSCSDYFTSSNGLKQGGTLSPVFFNVYMDNLSLQLNAQPIGCSTGNTVVNHMLYADGIVLFAPSAKGLQKLLDTCFNYGCSHDINPLKSVVMYVDYRKVEVARPMMIGGGKLNFVTTYTWSYHP